MYNACFKDLLLCVQFIFAYSKRCQFAVVPSLPCNGLDLTGIIQVFFVVTELIAEVLLLVFFICNAVKRVEHS